MKKTNLGIVALTLLGASVGSSFAQSLILNLGPLSGSQLVFSGHSFNFSPATPSVGIGPGGSVPDQWYITSESGSAASGSALNLDGAFGNGPFNYGPISTSGAIQSATATTPGNLFISDGTGYLQGLVNFIDITTIGSAGGLVNASLQINLSDVTYTGANADLQYLTANQPGVVDLAFQFAAGGLTLSELSAGPTYGTSYNGSISTVAVPEPSSLAMSVLGGLGAMGFAFRKRNN
jgi:hypothetical protein